MPDARPPRIVDQAAVIAMRLPGFGNPFLLKADVFDGAMSALMDAAEEESSASSMSASRSAVERDMKRMGLR